MKRIKYVLLLMVLSMLCLSACEKTADKETDKANDKETSEVADNKTDIKEDDDKENSKKEDYNSGNNVSEKNEKNTRLKLTDIKDDSRSTYKGTLKAYIDSINNKDYETYYSIMTLDGLCSDWCIKEKEFNGNINNLKEQIVDMEIMFVINHNIWEMQENVAYYEGEHIYDGEVESAIEVYIYAPNSPLGKNYNIYVIQMYLTNKKWYVWNEDYKLDFNSIKIDKELIEKEQKTVEGGMEVLRQSIAEKDYGKFVSVIYPNGYVCGEENQIFYSYITSNYIVNNIKDTRIYNTEEIEKLLQQEFYKENFEEEYVALCEGTEQLGMTLNACAIVEVEDSKDIHYFIQVDGLWYWGGSE